MTLLCFAIVAGLLAAWARWPLILWPDPEEGSDWSPDVDEGSAPVSLFAVAEPSWAPPEPAFAWREKVHAGGRIVSPLFHHPRAAGRWCAELGLDPEHLTIIEVDEGGEVVSPSGDAWVVAFLEAKARMEATA